MLSFFFDVPQPVAQQIDVGLLIAGMTAFFAVAAWFIPKAVDLIKQVLAAIYEVKGYIDDLKRETGQQTKQLSHIEAIVTPDSGVNASGTVDKG